MFISLYHTPLEKGTKQLTLSQIINKNLNYEKETKGDTM